MVRHLEEQGIMYDLQHFFRGKGSCENQLVMLIEDLARNASGGAQSVIILMYFQRSSIKSVTVNSCGLFTDVAFEGVWWNGSEPFLRTYLSG